jgi:hypothetical protein
MASSPAPYLFIVGSPRTGSTLLRYVLNRSPGVCLASETHFLKHSRRAGLGDRLAVAAASSGDARRRAVREVVEELLRPRFWAWPSKNLEADAFVDRVLATDLSERALFALLIDLYVERQCGDRPIAVRGEKTPDHLYRVGTLARWFPEARFIHTFRDPRAIYASRLVRTEEGRRGMKARLPWVPARFLDPLLAPIEVVETSRVWLDAARLHRRHTRELGDRYRLVRFEDLVADPPAVLDEICAFVGIPFEERLLDETDVVGSSFEEERHVARGFDRRSVDRWRDHVHPLVKAWFGIVGRRELSRFGYCP